MSVIGSNILAGASGQGGDYTIARSLRFRSSASAYLNRTPASAGSKTTWTFSCWFKRGSLTNSPNQTLLSASGGSAEDMIRIIGTAGSPNQDKIGFYIYNGSYIAGNFTTTQVLRDPSAWYHLVWVWDTTNATSTDRVRLYINGQRITTFDESSYPSLNAQSGAINNAYQHEIGRQTNATTRVFDGYLTEVNFIDGQALTPSSFGANSPTTGVWQPKKYVGTYGTNGFYLPFTNNASTTTLGNDFSGNGNNWTTNNISLTAGATYDSMTDVPTLTSATASNFCVLNPLATNTVGVGTLSNGNLNFSIPNTFTAIATMSASSGKYYWEAVATTNALGIGLKQVNVVDRYSNSIYYTGNDLANGDVYINGTGSAYGSGWTTGDVIGVAVDMDGGTVTFYKNNVSQGAIPLSYAPINEFVPSFVSGAGLTFSGYVNFGQRPFAYTPPTGFVALNTFNLPTPTIGATASTQAGKYFNAVTFNGNGSFNTVDVGFAPDFAWVKSRSNAFSHNLSDIIRGNSSYLVSNSTAAEDTAYPNICVFGSNGVTLSADSSANVNGTTNVGWFWDAGGTGVSNTAGSITSTVSANTSAGFSVVTFTGNGNTAATVGHGLGVTPRLIILKDRQSTASWLVYHASVTDTTFKYLLLNSTAAVTTNASTVWGAALPTSSVFGVNCTQIGGSTNNFVAYCFSEVAGYSKFGSYTGNGSTDGTFVHLGFRPKFVMIKATSSVTYGSWIIKDTSRNQSNTAILNLYPNASWAEDSETTTYIDLLSNGFKCRGATDTINGSGSSYIYMAFAENPFKYSLAR